jgi:hypothetical protein
MKTVLLTATLVGALIAAGQAVAKTKVKGHNRQVQQEQVATAQPGDGGYHQASGFEMVKAQCELVANGLQPSPGFVMGSQAFVTGAAIGSGIGGLIVHARNYDNCMTLHGYAKN